MKQLVSDAAVTRGDREPSFLMCCDYILFFSPLVPVLAQVSLSLPLFPWGWGGVGPGVARGLAVSQGVQGNFNCQLDTVT